MKYLWRLLSRKKLIALAYHLISDKPAARRLARGKSPEQFEEDLIYLRRYFQPVGYHRLLRAREEGAVLPLHPIILTFDDGHAEFYSVVRPLLIRWGLPAIFFITTDFIDNKAMSFRHKAFLVMEKLAHLSGPEQRAALDAGFGEGRGDLRDSRRLSRQLKSLDPRRIDELSRRLKIDTDSYLRRETPYLTSNRIAALAADGFIIGGHGKDHRRLSDLSPAEREEEIVGSCRRIREITGQESVPFAFPFDGRGVSPSWLKEVQSRHRFIRLFFDSRFSDQSQDLVIKRILVDSTSGIKRGRSNLARLIGRAYSEVA